MKDILIQVLLYLVIFSTGFSIFYLLDLTIRGVSHWQLNISAGIILIFLGLINEFPSTYHMNIFLQMLIGGTVITLLELIFGLIFNRDYKFWCYTMHKANFKGQISLEWFVVWCLWSYIGVTIDEFIRLAFVS